MLRVTAWSILILLGRIDASTAQESFVFQGLGLHTTIADATRRYPRSSILDHHVYVSDADARNHVYAIDIPSTTSPTLRVFFERTLNGRVEYPRCDDVIETVRKDYGPPAQVVEFDEERVRNRRYSWTGPNATLVVVCVRIERSFWASDLSISSPRR